MMVEKVKKSWGRKGNVELHVGPEMHIFETRVGKKREKGKTH